MLATARSQVWLPGYLSPSVCPASGLRSYHGYPNSSVLLGALFLSRKHTNPSPPMSQKWNFGTSGAFTVGSLGAAVAQS